MIVFVDMSNVACCKLSFSDYLVLFLHQPLPGG